MDAGDLTGEVRCPAAGAVGNHRRYPQCLCIDGATGSVARSPRSCTHG